MSRNCTGRVQQMRRAFAAVKEKEPSLFRSLLLLLTELWLRKNKVMSLVKAMVFPVVMYGCESWTIKKAEHWGIDAFELWCWRRLLRVPWIARRSNQSILKEISPECSFWRTDAEAENAILWQPDAKNWLIGRAPNAGEDWRQEEKGTTEDEMAGRHHWLDGHEFGWTPGVGDGQGGLVCCNSWGRKESEMTERLNWAERSDFIPSVHWWMDHIGNSIFR